MKKLSYRLMVSASIATLLLMLSACQVDYKFHEDIKTFVDDGLNAVQLLSATVTADDNVSGLSHAVPGYSNEMYLDIRNPRNFDVTYTLAPVDGSLYDVPPVTIEKLSPTRLRLVFTPKVDSDPTVYNDPADRPTLPIRLTAYVASIKRTFPEIKADIACYYPPSAVTVTFGVGVNGIPNLQFTPAERTIYEAYPGQSASLVQLGAVTGSDLATNGTDWKWFVNGADIGVSASSWQFSSADYTPGDYNITATVMYNGVLYSGDLVIHLLSRALYSVIYDPNGGTNGPPDGVFAPGSTVTIPAVVPTASAGWVFEGWYTNNWSATPNQGAFAPNEVLLGTMPNHTVTFHAHWTINSSTVYNPVTALTASSDYGMVTLKWTDPASVGFDYVHISWLIGGNPLSLKILPGVQTATIHGLVNETRQSFAVTAVYADNTSSSVSTVSATPHDPALMAQLMTVPVTPSSQPFNQGGAFNHTLNAFSIGKFEVTYRLWYEVKQAMTNYTISNNGVEGSAGLPFSVPQGTWEPVTSISWRDAMVWCNAYSEYMHLEPVYYSNAGCTEVIRDSNPGATPTDAGQVDNPYVKWNANGYRLPTEGEWEYAARYAGVGSWTALLWASGATGPTSDAVATGNVAVYDDGPTSKTAEVGTRAPNYLGLYDMSGNLAEFVWDWAGAYPSQSQINYRGPASGTYRQVRGGSWTSSGTSLNVANRGMTTNPQNRLFSNGFRVARSGKSDGSAINYVTYAYVAGINSSSGCDVIKYAVTDGTLTNPVPVTVSTTTNGNIPVMEHDLNGGRLYLGLSDKIYPLRLNSGDGSVITGTFTNLIGVVSDLLISPNGSYIYVADNRPVISVWPIEQATGLIGNDVGSLGFPDVSATPKTMLFGPKAFHALFSTGMIQNFSLDASGNPDNVGGTGFMLPTTTPQCLFIGDDLYMLTSTGASNLSEIIYYTVSGPNDTYAPTGGSVSMSGYQASSFIATPDGKYIYVVSMANNDIKCFSRDASTGMLTHMVTPGISLLSSTRYDLQIDPTGKYLYVVSGQTNRISIISINSDGSLSLKQTLTIAGFIPTAIRFARFPTP